MNPVKRLFFTLLKHTLNPATLRAARTGIGPFSLVEHVGRKTGRRYEVPIIVAEGPGGFVAELTYGSEVNWYRNVVAGGGRILHRGRWYRIVDVEDYPVDAGMRAFGAKSVILKLLRRREFRLLRTEPD